MSSKTPVDGRTAANSVIVLPCLVKSSKRGLLGFTGGLQDGNASVTTQDGGSRRQGASSASEENLVSEDNAG